MLTSLRLWLARRLLPRGWSVVPRRFEWPAGFWEKARMAAKADEADRAEVDKSDPGR